MSLLSDIELAHIRSVQLQAMPDLCSISRNTVTPDGAGGQASAWSTVLTSVKCRVWRMTANERQAAGRLAQDASFTVTLPHDTDVRSADRIVLADGRTLEVNGKAPGSWETARRVYAREVV